MKFAEALKKMQSGQCMKRPAWGGFWSWDPLKKTIMMHCREADSDTGKDTMDIRETQRVEYTMLNVAAEDWEPATVENCELLGGIPKFDFGTAIQYLKRGMKLKRIGWNGKNQHIELACNISFKAPDGREVNPIHEAIGNNAIAFFGTSGVQIGWLASQADMLADDWTFSR